MLKVSRLIDVMQTIAPISAAETWDNVGLLLGDPHREIEGPILLTIDLTEDVTDEALGINAGAVIAYHPPIFHPLTRLTADSPRARSLLALIEAGVALYSPHTALDAARSGLADWLIDQIATDTADPGMGADRRALTPHQRTDPTQTHKLVTFVPEKNLDTLREALGRVGAGVIGEYALCSFNIPGRGTFFGAESTSPTVGRRGRLERVDEVRMEMVCPAARLPEIIGALRDTHPYEEPAFDLFRIEPAPDRTVGAGRAVTLEAPATPDLLAERLKRNLGLDTLKLGVASEKPLTRVGACPGAGASLVDAAIDNGCGLFVTGEMRHHEVLAALDKGCSIILAGHTNTERGYLPTLRDRITELEPTLDVRVSRRDRPPFDWV